MDQFNFNRQVNGLKGQGDGWRRDIDVDMRNAYLPSDGSALTTTLTTNPGFAVIETNAIVLRWNSAIVVPAGFDFYVPGDYDQSQDELRLRAVIQMTGATDHPVLTVNSFRKRAGAATTTTLGAITATSPSAGISPLTSAQAPAFVPGAASAIAQWDLSRLGHQPGDTLFFTITPAAHATDGILCFELISRYRSVLALYNEIER